MHVKIRAILFDLDGVLVDTLHYHYLGWQKMFSDYGSSITEHSVLLHEGRNSREILPILMEEAGVCIPPEDHDTFIEGKPRRICCHPTGQALALPENCQCTVLCRSD